MKGVKIAPYLVDGLVETQVGEMFDGWLVTERRYHCEVLVIYFERPKKRKTRYALGIPVRQYAELDFALELATSIAYCTKAPQ